MHFLGQKELIYENMLNYAILPQIEEIEESLIN